jgi:hypothetical protein
MNRNTDLLQNSAQRDTYFVKDGIDRGFLSARDNVDRNTDLIGASINRNADNLQSSAQIDTIFLKDGTDRGFLNTNDSVNRNADQVNGNINRNTDNLRNAIEGNGSANAAAIERTGGASLLAVERNGAAAVFAAEHNGTQVTGAVDRVGLANQLAIERNSTNLGGAIERNGNANMSATERVGAAATIAADRNGAANLSAYKFKSFVFKMNDQSQQPIISKNLEYVDIENIPINKLYHIAVSFNNSIMEIYTNGGLYKAITLKGQPIFNKGNMYIKFDKSFNGTIYQLSYTPLNTKLSDIVTFYNSKPKIQ